jgi:DNA-binding NarL/FixJ family response regulator
MVCLLQESSIAGQINTASCYEQACGSIQSDPPDVILLDINLPGQSGIDVLRMINENKLICKVIMISNHDNEYYRHQCKQLGAAYFLDKTHDFGMVNSIIDKMSI